MSSCRRLFLGCCNGECMTYAVRVVEEERNLEELNKKEIGMPVQD